MDNFLAKKMTIAFCYHYTVYHGSNVVFLEVAYIYLLFYEFHWQSIIVCIVLPQFFSVTVIMDLSRKCWSLGWGKGENES